MTRPALSARAHDYRFTVYALNTFFGSSLPDNPRLLQALAAIARTCHRQGHADGQGTALTEARLVPQSDYCQ